MPRASPSWPRPPRPTSPSSRCSSTTPASTTSASPGVRRASRRSPRRPTAPRGTVPLYPDPLEQITDQIGVRVITYVHSDVAAVAEVLDDELAMLDDRDLGEETARSGRFGYASRHLLVQTHPGAELPTLEGHRASVQVRTVLQHAWAEFEHDIRYKGNVPEDAAADLDRRFTLAAGLIELADREFATIRERIQAAAPGSADGARRRPHRRAGAGHLPGRPLQRRRLVAHRPLRLDRRPAHPARHRHASTTSPTCSPRSTPTR